MTFKKIGQAAALDKSKWMDFLLNGGIVVLSAIITYVSQNVGNLDLGEFGPIAVAGISLVLKYLQKWIEGLNKKETDIKPVPPVNPNQPDFPVN